jgi:mono/diheme cytochrome c family protein
MKNARSITVLASTLLLASCAGTTSRKPPIEIFPDMDRQPKVKPQTVKLRPVSGTVALGQLKDDEPFYTGLSGGMYLGKNPLPMDRATLTRGQQRFNIYCTPCHDRTGTGHGIVPQKSSWLPANLSDDRVRAMVDGELFNVISHGRRSMPGYRFQVNERDRWAIVAYVRALQRAGTGTVDDVPQELRGELR